MDYFESLLRLSGPLEVKHRQMALGREASKSQLSCSRQTFPPLFSSFLRYIYLKDPSGVHLQPHHKVSRDISDI